jgi:hypothetical protein
MDKHHIGPDMTGDGVQVKAVIGLVELVLIAWVAYDAHALGARRGRLTSGLDMGPVGWVIFCLFCGIIGFGSYLLIRPRLVEAKQREHLRQADSSVMAHSPFGPVQSSLSTGAVYEPVSTAPVSTAPVGEVAQPTTALQSPLSSAPLMPIPSPGWYSDPGGTATYRWWDGTAWTPDTR